MKETSHNKKLVDNLRREVSTGEAVERAIALSKEDGPIWEYSARRSFSTRKLSRKASTCEHSS